MVNEGDPPYYFLIQRHWILGLLEQPAELLTKHVMDVESRSEEIFFHIVCLLIGFDLFGRIHLRTMSVDPFLPANLSTDKTLSFKLKLYIFNSESIPHYGNRH